MFGVWWFVVVRVGVWRRRCVVGGDASWFLCSVRLFVVCGGVVLCGGLAMFGGAWRGALWRLVVLGGVGWCGLVLGGARWCPGVSGVGVFVFAVF